MFFRGECREWDREPNKIGEVPRMVLFLLYVGSYNDENTLKTFMSNYAYMLNIEWTFNHNTHSIIHVNTLNYKSNFQKRNSH